MVPLNIPNFLTLLRILAVPVVVVALLDAPIVNPDQESGSPYFREPLDLLLGVVRGDDREFLVYHADRRRFQPAERDGAESR